MEPILPSNPLTITDHRDYPVTSQQVVDKYGGNFVDRIMVERIRQDLLYLQQLDTYHRRIDPEREAAKRTLNKFLNWIQIEYPHLLRPR